MFADISGSTNLYDQLGDDVAKRNIDRCLDELQVMTETHGGMVIKKIGDELMCRFETADAAVSAATVFQSELKNLQSSESIHLSIRVGIHYGEVIEDDSDIFGDAVNIAARIAGIAKGGQIITTEATVQALSAKFSSQVRQVDLTRVKGKQEKLAVFEVIWEKADEVTRMATQLLLRSTQRSNKLVLTLGPKQCELENDTDSISIGRDESCDLVVGASLASRKHAYCELRRGKFVVVDEGTNGTYVQANGGDEVYLRREEMVLRGEGVISLGKPVTEADTAFLIHYHC